MLGCNLTSLPSLSRRNTTEKFHTCTINVSGPGSILVPPEGKVVNQTDDTTPVAVDVSTEGKVMTRDIGTQTDETTTVAVDVPPEKKVMTREIETQTEKTAPNTPRKIYLRKQINTKSSYIRYLKKINKSLKSEATKKKLKITSVDVIEFCDQTLPLIKAEFIKSQLLGKQNWTEVMKNLCLSIYIKSPKAYKFLTKILKLPSVDTLVRFLNVSSVSPGFDHSLLDNINSAVQRLNNVDRCVVLLMDEINLKKNLQYNIRGEYVNGLEDFGYGRRNSLPASSALCFMIRSITGNFRQLIGYVLSSGAVKINNLQSLLEKCLLKLDEIGLRVMCITTDQASNFSLLFKTLGVTPSDPYYWFDTGNYKRRIIVMPDVPHLIKSTRNAIYANYISTSEGVVTWKFIKEAYKLRLQSNFPYIPKITEAHVNLTPFGGKMKVKLASQVLSRSVGKALEVMRLEGKIDPSSFATEQFCLKMNDLFDVLNSSPSQRGRTPFHQELKLGSEGWKFLSEIKSWIEGWKIYRVRDNRLKTSQFRFVNGWLQAINGAKELLIEFNTNYNLHYIYTRRLCQDPLENCFGDIRGAGGWSDNPTCSQFEALFQRAAINSLVQISSFKNCEEDDTHNFLITNTSNKKIVKQMSLSKLTPAANLSIFFPSTNIGDLDELNGMRYVCGVLAKKILNFHKKKTCSVCNLTTIIDNMNNKEYVFVQLKRYEHLQAHQGLTFCSENFFGFFKSCEEIFCKEFKTFYLNKNLTSHIVNKLKENVKYKFCDIRIENFAFKKFVTLRIYYCIKFFNNENFKRGHYKSYKKYKKIICK